MARSSTTTTTTTTTTSSPPRSPSRLASVAGRLLLGRICLLLLLLHGRSAAHTVITYPGWRGNNLHTNESFPYGMQWMYPCGGMPLSTNRTLWPITGGAIGIQPGWFQGHATAFFYINMGFETMPRNMSFPMLPVFQITGPSRDLYPGSFCLPQVPMPANAPPVAIGGNATIQVIEAAVHGAGLFNCVDITFADPRDVPEVNASNCVNTSNIGFNQVYTAPSLSAALPLAGRLPSMAALLVPSLVVGLGVLWGGHVL
ncbi:MAG: hypothetical protein M1826_000759 [Phylliscum demangeonii]|nr:MAG: hypothetical protein M1826_000759 [Phylliscum demangeonii]